MKISEFCKNYNIRHQTVYTKIRRHRKDIEDMCEQIKYLKNIFANYYKPIKPDVIL